LENLNINGARGARFISSRNAAVYVAVAVAVYVYVSVFVSIGIMSYCGSLSVLAAGAGCRIARLQGVFLGETGKPEGAGEARLFTISRAAIFAVEFSRSAARKMGKCKCEGNFVIVYVF